MIIRKYTYIIILLLALFFSGCNNYKSYTDTVKITLVTEEAATSAVTSQAVQFSEKDDTTHVTETNKTNTVYYTKSGKRYHYSNPCGKGTYYECTLKEALEKGLTPCGKCVK